MRTKNNREQKSVGIIKLKNFFSNIVQGIVFVLFFGFGLPIIYLSYPFVYVIHKILDR